ncbi:unnamed protein product [Toxocara canis]|uniref:Arginine decarboxylase n=1 Tax=Toxocara canis TaxID=6265 RepID=A0A183VBB8_TOXCA|nr:unnamed protein product [Toxocara canis]
MRFATLNLTSSLDSSVLVGFASLEELSSDEAFDLLLAECSTGSDVTREVEFENNEIPHEASCATVLALLSDTGRWIRQARMPQAGQIADDLPPVIAIIRPNNKFDHLMITSLYTDCMVLIHGKANVENALA